MSKPDNYEYVFERLNPGQNLIDQPPFSGLKAEETIFPHDFFKETIPQAYVYFIRAVAFAYPNHQREFSKKPVTGKVVQARKAVTADYLGSFDYTATKFVKALEKYALWNEYLRFMWSNGYFKASGEPHQPNETFLSYVGYVVYKEKGAELAKLVGLEEVLPNGEVINVLTSLPAKGSLSRRFRFFKSEAMG